MDTNSSKQHEAPPGQRASAAASASEKNEPDTKSSQSSLPENSHAMHPPKLEDLETALPEQPEIEGSPRNIHGIKWVICAISIFSSVFLYALDNTIVATIQPSIIRSFGEIEKLPWVSVAFQVTSVACDLTWAKLYAKFNGKTLFLASVAIFEIGSAVCGAAPTMNAEIIGRAICGAGGIGIYMGALNILAVTTTAAERPVYISVMGICWGSGTILGPVVGGAFADSSATWRWSFYINLVVGGVAAPAYIFLLPSTNTHLKSENFMKRVMSTDWVGTVLIAGATVSGIMEVNFGGVLFSWSSGEIIGCFVCSGVLFIMFGVQQAFAIFTTKHDRILPCDIIMNWEANVLFAQTASGLGASLVFIYFIPLYFQFVQNDKALDAGVRLLPAIVVMIAGSIFTGTLLGKGFWFMPFALAGASLVVIGGALMYATVGVDTMASPIYGYSVLLGLGAGLFTQGPISVVQSLFPPDRVADATGFVGFGQVVGIAIMLAVANAVFLNRATIGLEHLLPDTPLREVQAAIQGVGSELFQNLSGQLRTSVLEVIVHSLNKVYILVIVAGAVTVFTCPFLKRPKRA